MTDKSLRDKLIEFLIDASPMFESDGLKDEDNLEDAGLDSLDIVSFLLSIEENFGIKISDEELADLKTLGDFMKYINGAKA